MREAALCPFCGSMGDKCEIDIALKNHELDKKEIRQLKKLVRDMWRDGINDDTPFEVAERLLARIHRLRIEVE